MLHCRLCSRLTREFLPLDHPVALETDTGRLLTNREFLTLCAAWAAGFDRLRRTGCYRAALFFENTADFAAALFGAWRVGISTLLLSDALPGTLERVTTATKIDCTAGDCRLSSLPTVEPDPIHPLPLYADAPLDETAPLLALLTSGSTGEPKIVSKRLEQLFVEVEGIDRAMTTFGLGTGSHLSPSEMPVLFSTVTHQHIYGLLFRALWPLLGAGILTAERLHYPEALASAMRRCCPERHCGIISSPAHLKRLDEPALFEGLAGHIRFVSSSAGPLDEEGAMKTRRAFGRFPFEILGSTETGGIARRQRTLSETGLETPAWHPMPGVDIGLERPDSTVIQSWQKLSECSDADWPLSGRLAMKSRQLEGRDFELGNDKIELNRDGSFYLIGRADRIVKVEGKRIALAMLEKPLAASPWVAQTKALLLAGRREEIGVVVELTDCGRAQLFAQGKTALTRHFRSMLTPVIDPVAVPKRWRLVEKMPINAQGKTPLALVERLFDPRRLEWFTVSESHEPIRKMTLRTTIPSHLIWFSGHFPNRPILPGVAILKLTGDAVKDTFGFVSGPQCVRNLKFKAMTRPQMTVFLELEEKKPGEIRFCWRRLLKDGNMTDQASGLLIF